MTSRWTQVLYLHSTLAAFCPLGARSVVSQSLYSAGRVRLLLLLSADAELVQARYVVAYMHCAVCGPFLANVNVLRYVCYMRSQFRLSSVCRL